MVGRGARAVGRVDEGVGVRLEVVVVADERGYVAVGGQSRRRVVVVAGHGRLAGRVRQGREAEALD